MKRVLYLFVLVFLLSSISSAQEKSHICSLAKIKHFSKLEKTLDIEYPGDQNIDVTYYKLDVVLNYTLRNIRGDITIKGKSLIDSLFKINFDLEDPLTVNSIKLNGESVVFFHQNDLINIILPLAFNRDEEFSIIINYEGTPVSTGFGSFAFSSHNGEPAIWTLSEPYGASDWWPCKDTPADKADSADIWITVDKSMIPVSNGALTEIIDNGRTHTYKWHSKYPIAQYLISLAITNYELYTNEFITGNDTMIVYHYNYPERVNSIRKEELDKTINMLEVFTELYGPYPFLDEKYGHAEFGWGGGMEHQTCSSMGSFGSGIVSHELAHQWFGDKITCKDWHHIWLNEGFATYSEAAYIESTNNFEGYKSKMVSEMRSAKKATSSIWVQDISSVSQIFDGNRSYAKGAVVLHMLRGVVGTETFYDILRAYSDDSNLAYGVAVTEDFQRIAEDVSGMDLEYFFSQWIYGENYPKYTFDWEYEEFTDGTYNVTVIIEQTSNSNPLFFSMPIELSFEVLGGYETFVVFNNQQRQEFQLNLSQEPIALNFDPDNWILKDAFKKEYPIIHEFELEQNYPNPFNPSTTIKYSIPSIHISATHSADVTLIVYDILGRKIATLVDKEQKPGNYEVQFDASSLSSGIYFYKLQFGNFSAGSGQGFAETKKMVLIL